MVGASPTDSECRQTPCSFLRLRCSLSQPNSPTRKPSATNQRQSDHTPLPSSASLDTLARSVIPACLGSRSRSAHLVGRDCRPAGMTKSTAVRSPPRGDEGAPRLRPPPLLLWGSPSGAGERAACRQTRKRPTRWSGVHARKSGLAMAYFPQGVAPPVSSALRRFTSVFGMGTGGATALESPAHA